MAGFASQSLFGPAGSDNGMFFARTAIAAAGGCAGAVIAKGSCANGAITAAFAHMYNAEKIIPRGKIFGRTYGIVERGKCCFESINKASQELMNIHNSYKGRGDAPEYEIGATLYKKTDGTYGFNDVITYFSTSSVAPFADVPKDSRPVGLFHNHPKSGFIDSLLGYDNENFSDRDITAIEAGRRKHGQEFRGYLVTPSGKLKQYPKQ